MITLLRPTVAFQRLGLSRSVGYERIQAGLLPRFLKIGGSRASALPDHEVEALARAYIAGASESQLRVLVARLHEQRKTAANDLLIGPDSAIAVIDRATKVSNKAREPAAVAKAQATRKARIAAREGVAS